MMIVRHQPPFGGFWRAISGARGRPQSRPYPPDTNAPCVLLSLASRTPEARDWHQVTH